MAINPLQPPINYAGMAPQVNVAQQFAEFGQVLIDRQKRVQAEKVKEEYKTDLEAAIANPTQETWSNMIGKYPQQREAFAEIRKGYGDIAATNEFNQGFEVSMALENDRPEIARERLLNIIAARKDKNMPTGIYERTLDALVAGNTKQAQAGVNYALSMADPDRFKKQVDARTAALKAPSEVTEAAGQAAEAEAKGKVATGTVDIKIRQEKSAADEALAKANVAVATAPDAISKASAEREQAQAQARKAKADADVAANTVISNITKAQQDAAKATSDAKTALANASNATEKAAAELRLAQAQAKEKEADANVAAETVKARIAEATKPKLAAAVQEAIDYGNLTDAQRTTFDTLQVLKKPPAAVTKIEITNLDKTAQDELGKLVPDLYEQANSAATQVQDIPRYRTALQNAIVGPLANARLTASQIGEFLGFTGDKRINATRELIQGLSEMALKSRSMLTGQGSITEGEQALLLKARSGDISFTKGELDIILNVADRAARAQYEKSTNLLRSASTKSPTAQMFLDNVRALPTGETPASSPNTVKVGDMTYTRPPNFTDKQWSDYKQNVGAK
jgi:hypothetical protein